MNLKYVLLSPVLFLVFLYFQFPYFMPDSFNKDFKEMENNIYVTPFGVQFNSRAKELCNRYPSQFLRLQKLAAEERLSIIFSYKDIISSLPPHEIDLSEFNEAEQEKIKSELAELKEKRIKREGLMIEYYENTLKTINSNIFQSREIFSDKRQHCN